MTTTRDAYKSNKPTKITKLLLSFVFSSLASSIWAEQITPAPDQTIPDLLCRDITKCQKIAKPTEWPAPVEAKGLIYGNLLFTFILPPPDKAVRSFGSDSGLAALLEDGSAFSFYVTEKMEGTTSAFEYVFDTSISELPKQLPVDYAAAVVMYGIKDQPAKDTEFRKYKKDGWTVVAGFNETEGVKIMAAHKQFTDRLFIVKLNPKATQYFDQVMSSISLGER
ncbi:hypothetical protein [Spartinivicinus poritis]|uniref:Secreted protein n=1 Tax=Spartinivicinus poritis TaxID=2994640 RepID=A0ABT5UI69_9GAMM|nr:hypothetical protein [Spartinivicinus sp. A2-2]MDE1465222.1 hypothetical protein [Spartinivicinus sp. A2-2]